MTQPPRQAAGTTGAGLRRERRGEVALLLIDQPGRSVNLLDVPLLTELSLAIDELAADPEVRAVVLTSAQPGRFLAGADVASFLDYRTQDEVVEAIAAGNAVLARIESSSKPWVAAIDGACLGGGTELALALHYRLASTGASTRIGLPEVQLGLLPGLGGCVRLPERVGVAMAADMILSGRNLYPRPALRAGLVDALVHSEGLIEAALAAARGLAAGSVRPRRVKRSVGWSALETRPGRELVLRRAGSAARRRSHGNYPAVEEILAVLSAYVRGGRSAGLAASTSGFARLLFTNEARALIHLFFAQTAARRNPWAADALEVERIAVLGAGLMGAGITEVSAAAGLDVLLKDVGLERALRGKGEVYRGLSARVGKGRSAFERDRASERVAAISDYSPLATAQVTIEAVLEEPSLKREMLAAAEAVTAERHVFASNTSAIPIAEIASEALRPEAVLGMHYFSPVPKMPLLEVVVTQRTAPWAVGTAVALGQRQGKTVIVVGDGPGFYTTRVLGAYVSEAMRLLAEGVDALALEAALVAYGFPLGPLAMLDDVGLQTSAKISQVMEQYGPASTADTAQRGAHGAGAVAVAADPGPVAARLVAAGYLGRRAGKGWYVYEGGKRQRRIDPGALAAAGLPSQARAGAPGAAEVVERVSMIIVREALACLDEGVLKSPRDGDLGAVFGFGFPPFRGGPFFLVDQLGADKVLATLERLSARHGERFAPPASLRQRAEKGEPFHPLRRA